MGLKLILLPRFRHYNTFEQILKIEEKGSKDPSKGPATEMVVPEQES